MAVRIRLKRMGRKHRPFFRICAMDIRKPNGGRILEELGHYDPLVKETDARVVLNNERVDYWIGVGAIATDKAAVLIKKYGSKGTHLEAQKSALEKMGMKPRYEPPKVPPPKAPEPAPAAEGAAADAPAAAEGEAAAAPAEAAPAEGSAG